MTNPPDPESVAAGHECKSVWRCAIGDSVSGLDVLKNKWMNSRRKADREAGAELARVLDLVWAARDPAPANYNEAATSGREMVARIRAVLQSKEMK